MAEVTDLPNYIITVENILCPKNAVSQMGFDPRTCRILSHHSTN